MKRPISVFSILVLLAGMLLLFPVQASAHCDTMKGPVVKAAQKALETGDVRLVLVWVQKKDEAEVRDLFDQTRKVRMLGSDAKVLADRYFFENLVRIHRAGEGEPFTGLKEGGEVDPGIEAAEKAIEAGSVKELTDHLGNTMKESLESSFHRVMETGKSEPGDVESGRKHVAAYVQYIHQVEEIHQAVMPAKDQPEDKVSMHRH